MALIQKDFAKNNSLSGIWEISESEVELKQACDLTEYDKNLLLETGSEHRRIELLAVRALLKTLNPEIEITYDNRKPICNKGFISISHSDSFAAVIWHPTKRSTVDIERINERIHRIAKRALNEPELRYAKNNTETLTTIWSAKECIYKIANEPGIEFKSQIEVAESTSNDFISCNLILTDISINYKLIKTILRDHVLVWGVF